MTLNAVLASRLWKKDPFDTRRVAMGFLITFTFRLNSHRNRGNDMGRSQLLCGRVKKLVFSITVQYRDWVLLVL
jgi:hypothetical protein